jgi:hypothetical protein
MKPQRQPMVRTEKRLMGDDPLATESILERFYKPEPPTMGPTITPITDAPKAKEKPTHYKVVCISLYNEDIEHLESMVAELKRRGHTKANKSQLIRAALAQVDLGKIPKGF